MAMVMNMNESSGYASPFKLSKARGMSEASTTFSCASPFRMRHRSSSFMDLDVTPVSPTRQTPKQRDEQKRKSSIMDGIPLETPKAVKVEKAPAPKRKSSIMDDIPTQMAKPIVQKEEKGPRRSVSFMDGIAACSGTTKIEQPAASLRAVSYMDDLPSTPKAKQPAPRAPVSYMDSIPASSGPTKIEKPIDGKRGSVSYMDAIPTKSTSPKAEKPIGNQGAVSYMDAIPTMSTPPKAEKPIGKQGSVSIMDNLPRSSTAAFKSEKPNTRRRPSSYMDI